MASITSAQFDALTVNVSHELAEVVTNPLQPDYNGWHADAPAVQEEIADLCPTSTGTTPSAISLGPYKVTRFWSNRQNSCLGNDWGVHIQVQEGEACLGGLLEGEEVHLSAKIASFSGPSPSILTAHWTWTDSGSGSVAVGNSPGFSARMPPAPATATVKVTVTFSHGKGGITTLSGEATLQSLTAAEVAWQSRFCEILSLVNRVRLEAIFNWEVNPLGPPLRQFTCNPVQAREIYELHREAKQIAQLATELVELYETRPREGP